MQLNDAQIEAVQYLEGPLLVLAGPGTGKTQLLSQKVAYILEHTDADASNILCLTFTDSGAQNMRERLKSTIGVDALRVTIGTYHTFGSEILGMYKTYSDSYDRRLETAIDEVMRYKIVRELQSKLPGNDILRGDAVSDIISVISDAKGAGLTAEDLALIARQNMEDFTVLSEAISPLLKNVVPRKFKESYENAYLPIFSFLKNYEHAKPIIKRIERIINSLARELDVAMQEAETANSVKSLTKWRNAFFELDDKGNYRLKGRVANLKLASIARIMSDYEELLLRDGLYDFDDMIQEAIRALREDAGFKATLAERYQFILLDEFQDTNPSQLAIVKELTDYDKPIIMAVGDDDQAIYEFQGALSSNLSDFRDYYDAKVVKLTENYRSTQEILDFSRKIIQQAPDRFEDKELQSHRKADKSCAICRYEFEASDAEYGFVADKIAELVESGIEQKQIAVISAKHKYFEPFLPYLKAKEGIKIAYEKRDNLFDIEPIHELLQIAKYVNEIANEKRHEVQLMEILSYPFFGLSPLEIIRLSGEARAARQPQFEYLSEHGSEEIKGVTKFLADLAMKSFTDGLGKIMDYLIGVTDLNGYRSEFMSYYENLSYHDDEEKQYAIFSLYENLAALKGRIERYGGGKKLKLADLVEMISDYEEANMPLGIVSPYRDADDAVQIMTAHKAKGLEFDHVFILTADHTAWGKGKGNNTLLSLPKNVIQIRHTGITDGEKIRVLYVALTRAKKALYITNSLMDFKAKSPERLEYLNERESKNENGETEIISPFIPSMRVTEMRLGPGYDKKQENLRNWLSSYIIESPDMLSLYRERVKGIRMSASMLTSFIDIIYAGPMEFFRSRILRAPGESETEQQVLGNLVHETFDQVTRNTLSDEEAVKFYLTRLDEYDASADIKEPLRVRGAECISGVLEQFGDIVRNGKSEIDFGSERLVLDGVPITGKIDHVLINEKDKSIEIYDYKTAKYRTEGWNSHPTLFEYMLQLNFYKALIELSPKYRNYKVLRGHILFVTKDPNDEMVHDRLYEYNDADWTLFKDLLKSVYHQITTLDFINNPEIMITPDKERSMRDIKEFITLLLA